MLNEELIRQKKEEIEKLKQEIKELRDNNTIKGLTTVPIYGVGYYDHIPNDKCIHMRNDSWEMIRKLCVHLHKDKYRNLKHMKAESLTEDERRLSAKMADEIIEVWNKYLFEVYGRPPVEIPIQVINTTK